MNSIGGYFELELPQGEEYHKNAIRLNTGRNAFEYILKTKQYKKVYLPYYTCDVMLEPIQKLNIEVEFYHIDKMFNPQFDFEIIKEKEVFIYNNYFGICNQQVQEVAEQCNNLIVDNSQAFFSKPLPEVDTFYSPRKFFGLPDGAYLYTDKKNKTVFEKDISYNRVEHLLGRIDIGTEQFYQIFKENDNALIGQPIKFMSNLTSRLLCGINYKLVGQKRRENFLYLHKRLKNKNQLKFDITETEIPMVYPYLKRGNNSLRLELIKKNIYTAIYWPNVKTWIDITGAVENYLQENLMALPIDQRFGQDDLSLILTHILK